MSSKVVTIPVRIRGKSTSQDYEAVVSSAEALASPTFHLTCEREWSIGRLKLEVITLLHGKTPKANSSSCVLFLDGLLIRDFQSINEIASSVSAGSVVDCVIDERS
jgi:hypothetical protein